MESNIVIRRVRYALNLTDSQMIEIWALDGYKIEKDELASYQLKEDEPGYVECPKPVLSNFLDGLILYKRGPRKDGKPPVTTDSFLGNNMILKKLRIALNMREEDMLRTFEKADFKISKSELTALFRKKSHQHYRPCGDQMLRRFLMGLTIN